MNCFVKETYNTIWHFYHNSHGICFCKMTDENIREYQVLLPEGQDDFDVCIDDTDCIHLLCQNTDGDIMYLNHFNGQWRKSTLLKAKSPSSYKKDFSVRLTPNCLNAFYCITYNGKRMLTHHTIDANALPPSVIDCIDGPFCTATAKDCIYLFFYSETAQSWGTKKYNPAQKAWEDFVPTENIKNCKNPFLYIDADEKTHIVYEDNGYIAEYFDGKITDIGMGQNPVMVYQNYDMLIWEGIADNKIYIKRTVEQTPTVFMPGGFAKPIKMRLRYTGKESNINADMCHGNIVNGTVRTYGINNFFATAQKPVQPHTEESNTNTNIEIQKLKIQIGQLNSLLQKLQTQITAEDIEKINRRLDEVEEAVNKKTKLFNLL